MNRVFCFLIVAINCIVLVPACVGGDQADTASNAAEASQTAEQFTQRGPRMTMEELYREARIKASSIVPDEARQSLPIPVLHSEYLQVDFIFAPSFLSVKTGEILYPPAWQISFERASGNLLELRKVDPSYYGLNQAAQDEIGKMAMPEGVDAAQFIAYRTRLLKLCDPLFDAFQRGDDGASSRKMADEYYKLFQIVSERPLHPYYKARGQAFFSWLKKLRNAS